MKNQNKKDWSQYYGDKSGTLLDDFDKIVSALGLTKDQCYEQITNIRPKKINYWGGDVIDRIQFIYAVETKDKTIDVEGNIHGGTGGVAGNWTFESDYLLRMNGYHGTYGGETCVKFLEFRSFYAGSNYDVWTGSLGTKEGTEFKELVPACFFSRSSGKYLASIGCYKGELYNADVEQLKTEKAQLEKEKQELNTTKTNAEKDRDTAQGNLKKWTEVFGTSKTPNEIKKDLGDKDQQLTDLKNYWDQNFSGNWRT